MPLLRPGPMMLRQKGAALPAVPTISSVYAASLWTGDASNRSINNGLNLSGEGGLVHIKCRSSVSTNHYWMDTERGATIAYLPNLGTAEQTSSSNFLSSFNSNGYSMASGLVINVNAATFIGWAFRQSPRFLDVIKYTGNQTNRALAHNLAVEPGLIMIFGRNGNFPSKIWFKGMPDDSAFSFGSAASYVSGSGYFSGTADDTNIWLGSSAHTNETGGANNMIAYVFAHDPTGICYAGSYTGNGSTSGPNLNSLPFQPRFLMIKRNGSSHHIIFDAVRGLVATASTNDPYLLGSNAAEVTTADFVRLVTTGFQIVSADNLVNASGGTYYYFMIKA